MALKSIFFSITVAEKALSRRRPAIIVNKSVSLKATERNRVKRRVAHALRQIPGSPFPCEIIIRVHRSILGKGYQEIKRDLEQIIKRSIVES